MYDKLFKEHKLVATYSVAIVFLTLVGIFAVNSPLTLFSRASQNTEINRGCYYRSDCPPREAGNQSIFRCKSTLVCPVPTSQPIPTQTRATLSCSDCTAGRFTNLCLDTTRKASYCAIISESLPQFPNLSCIPCTSQVTPTRTVQPTRVATCRPLTCAAPPEGCVWEGGDSCSSCGNLVCSNPPQSSTEADTSAL